MSSPAHASHRWVSGLLLQRELERHRGRPGGLVLSGHHNRNYVVELDARLAAQVGVEEGSLGKFREPLETLKVVPRIWDESDVLEAVGRHIDTVPRSLAVRPGYSLHTYIAGTPLVRHHPYGSPVGEKVLRQIVRALGQIAEVPATDLPPRPPGWPEDKDTAGFLRKLADFAEHEVYRPARAEFGSLFADLGIDERPMEHLRRRADRLHRRPFSLLHTDLHRDNLVTLAESDELLILDWEIALYGDPLHELATHLVRMDYVPAERERVVELWAEEMTTAGLSARTTGLAEDLSTYIRFEHAQSVYTDTMRAARALPPGADRGHYAKAAEAVHRCLRRASGAGFFIDVPEREEVVVAVEKWHRRHSRRSSPPTAPRRGSVATRLRTTLGDFCRPAPPPLAGATHVIFDFDGPLCRLFAPAGSRGSSAPAIATELRDVLAGLEDRAPQLWEEPLRDDPIALFRQARDVLGDEYADRVEALAKTLEDLEVRAAAAATPTPGAVRLVRRLAAERVELGIASNNCRAAVDSYLDRAGIADYFGPVVGREAGGPMKPEPGQLEKILADWGVDARHAVLVGDSPADVTAAKDAGVRFVGYHRSAHRRRWLRRFSQEPVVADVAKLLGTPR